MVTKKGKIVLFVGPTRVGKTTMVEALRRVFPDSGVIVSLTTRPPRPWEKDGVDYEFVTEEEFITKRDKGEFYEWVRRPDGVYYASSQKQVHDLLLKHHYVFGTLDIEGCREVKKKEPDAITIFLYPGDLYDLEVRLRMAADLPEEKIILRLAIAREEMTHMNEFDEKVENIDGKFDETVQKVLGILKERGVAP